MVSFEAIFSFVWYRRTIETFSEMHFSQPKAAAAAAEQEEEVHWNLVQFRKSTILQKNASGVFVPSRPARHATRPSGSGRWQPRIVFNFFFVRVFPPPPQTQIWVQANRQAKLKNFDIWNPN